MCFSLEHHRCSCGILLPRSTGVQSSGIPADCKSYEVIRHDLTLHIFALEPLPTVLHHHHQSPLLLKAHLGKDTWSSALRLECDVAVTHGIRHNPLTPTSSNTPPNWVTKSQILAQPGYELCFIVYIYVYTEELS
jgi:hypothetical protein